MDDIERTVIELDQRSKSNTKRLDRLEKTTEAVQELATSVKLMAQNLERMTMLTAVVSALAGGFAAMLIK